MRNGICPKCNSTTVYQKKKGVSFEGGVYVHTGIISMVSDFISLICTTCGYFENYVTDQAKLQEVAQKWEQVPPSNT